MKFSIRLQNKDTNVNWWHDCEVDTENPYEWARQAVKRYNATLRPGEVERELLEVKIKNSENKT